MPQSIMAGAFGFKVQPENSQPFFPITILPSKQLLTTQRAGWASGALGMERSANGAIGVWRTSVWWLRSEAGRVLTNPPSHSGIPQPMKVVLLGLRVSGLRSQIVNRLRPASLI